MSVLARVLIGITLVILAMVAGIVAASLAASGL